MSACDAMADRMSAFLDGVPSEDLEAHLAICPACRHEMESLRKIDDALRAGPRLAWTPGLTRAIVARTRPRGLWRAGVAAAFLVAIAAITVRPRGVPADREALAQHARAVEILARQPDPPADPEVLDEQIRQLRLRETTNLLSHDGNPAFVQEYLAMSLDTFDNVRLRSAEDNRTRLLTLYRTSRTFASYGTQVSLSEPGDEMGSWAVTRLNPTEVSIGNFVQRHPQSRYSTEARLLLARHHAGRGDAIAALVQYAAIQEPAVFTVDVAREVCQLGDTAGDLYLGACSVQTLDCAGLQAGVRARSVFGLVRHDPREYSILGPPEHLAWLVDNAPTAVIRFDRGRAVIDPKKMDHGVRNAQIDDVMKTMR